MNYEMTSLDTPRCCVLAVCNRVFYNIRKKYILIPKPLTWQNPHGQTTSASCDLLCTLHSASYTHDLSHHSVLLVIIVVEICLSFASLSSSQNSRPIRDLNPWPSDYFEIFYHPLKVWCSTGWANRATFPSGIFIPNGYNCAQFPLKLNCN